VKRAKSWLGRWRDWRDDLDDEHGDELDEPRVWHSRGDGVIRGADPGPEHPALREARSRFFERLRERHAAPGVQRVPLAQRVGRIVAAWLRSWRRP
jgi:hypothetical protein